MNQLSRLNIGRLALPALFGALGSLCAPPASAATTDISNAPLASAGNSVVKPNLLFILDDSGSMMFDAMPDNAETQQGGSERKYWDTSYNCKWRIDELGQRGNHCDRVDPPFGAAEFNGLYYNPQLTYWPAYKADGTKYPSQTSWTAVVCDPFPSAVTCDSFFNSNYYNNGSSSVDPQNGNADLIGPYRGAQTWTNQYVKNWYGTTGATTFNVQNTFPEIVYCRNATDATSTCRRNGLSDVSDKMQTGNPFRYTSAIGGSLQTPTNPPTGHNGYPESPSVSEFWRAASSTQITVTTSGDHGIAAIAASGTYPAYSSPFKVIPRTNTGTGTSGLDWISNGGTSATSSNSCVTDGTCIVTVTASNQFTYLNSKTGQQLAAAGPFSQVSPNYGSYDLVVAFKNGTGSTVTTIYVTAPNHGLVAGDQIKVFVISNSGPSTNIIASNGNTVTVLASPAPTKNTFAYTLSTATGPSSATGYFQKTAFYNVPKLIASDNGAGVKGPLFYTIQPVEYCSDEYLNNCTAATAPTGAFIYPAPVRFCLTEFDANRWDTPTGKERTNTAYRCQKKYNETNAAGANYLGYIYPRYGKFQRTTVTPGTSASYTGRLLRKDCAGNAGTTPTGNCTGNEELTNFSNWFAYYRTRMPMMKTSTSIAFSPIGSKYRVGFLTINAAIPPGGNDFLGIADFTTTQKTNWYNVLFNQAPSGSTPLPMALSRAGRYFAGKNDGINKGMVPNTAADPMQYSCQQNFALLTTDGYWNQRAGKNLGDTSTSSSSESIGNQDNKNNCSSTDPHSVCGGVWDGYTTASSWTDADGNFFSSSGTLSDVARYYYDTDLRSSALGNATGALGGDVATDNVPNSSSDPATWQHMNTFGLGMSEGFMNYRKDYESAGSGDFFNVMNNKTGCNWDANCRWPVPGPRSGAALDDLWHAAVSGHGDFFYARDTAAVQDGLTSALNNLSQRNASAAAAATSTPNITPSDRMAFLSSYTTVQWNGEIQAKLIDPNTGLLSSTVVWSAQALLQSLVGTSTDSRNIYTFSASTSTKLQPFLYANLDATAQSWFANKCTPLTNMSQCSTLDPTTQLPVANDPASMINFLRGQSGYEATVFRDRAFALGDTVNAAPVFIGKPRQSFVDNVTPSYQQWAASSTVAGRMPMLYVGANDGMLHAFNANTGIEQWAYVPRILMPSMWRLADASYATSHVYYVDGTPSATEVFDGSNWRTILVGGLNSGGRGYYALDITNPSAPQALWEFCTSSTDSATAAGCSISDKNIGLSYGNPIITKVGTDPSARWVVLVTSGYNNVPGGGGGTTGDGGGYLYVLDAIKGTILATVATTTPPSTTSPSGLGKINVWVDTFSTDNTSNAAYGGDMQGNVWEFDFNKWPAAPSVKKIAQACADTSCTRPQPITTKPELGLINDTYNVLYLGTGRYLGLLDLTDPATQTPASNDAWQQSLYAFKISPHDSSDTLYGNLRNAANNLVKQSITIVSSTSRTTSTTGVNWASSNGWYVDFNPSNDSPGERVSVDPQLVLGTLIIGTNVPGGTCSVGGDSWFYQFDYKTGQFVSSSPSSIVGVKLTGAEIAGISIFQLQSGSLGSLVIRTDTQATQPGVNTSSASSAAKRSGWREVTPHN
jgi:type IV pilus assembly protein PilY1